MRTPHRSSDRPSVTLGQVETANSCMIMNGSGRNITATDRFEP